MAMLFSGWLGYGGSMQGNLLNEPVDPGYVRRSFVLGNVDNGLVCDVGSGTVGPATVSWGQILFAGLFDAPVAGNLLLWMPLAAPVVIQTGGTITTGGGTNRFFFLDLQYGAGQTHLWPTGAVVASSADGRPLTAGVALQFTNGSLSAQVVAGSLASPTLATLPVTPPSGASGQLWNNGGIIAIT